MARKKQVEYDLAKRYYINDGMSQKEIAERLNLSEKTVGTWVKKDNWEKEKTSLLVTKDKQISDLYNQLSAVNEEIKTRSVVRDIPSHVTT